MKQEKENVHKKHRERMRKKFISEGIDAFLDHEILEYLMFGVHRVKDTNPIAHNLIKRFGTLRGVFDASYDELKTVDNVGEAGAALIKLISQLSNRISRSTVPKKKMINSVQDAGEYCQSLMYGLKEERLILICVDSDKSVVEWYEISRGVTSATVVDMRMIVEKAMSSGATGVILCHNHPDDSTNPSTADVVATNKIVDILESINISVIDHIICNDKTYTSMSERGFMDMKTTNQV